MEYEKELENLIFEELLPLYLVGCRVQGVRPQTNEIIKKLMELKRNKTVLPAILDKNFGVLDQS